MILEVYWDGLWTLSFRLSQSPGHGYWLLCEVALRLQETENSASGPFTLEAKVRRPSLSEMPTWHSFLTKATDS